MVAELRDHRGRIIDLRITDNGDGSYSIRFTPPIAGNFKLCVSIFDRPIKESPFTIPVVDHNDPVWVFGSRGVSRWPGTVERGVLTVEIVGHALRCEVMIE